MFNYTTNFNLKRMAVIGTSVILIVLSALALARGGTIAHYVINAVILAVSLYGFFGAFYENIRYLQVFLVLLTVLLIWEIIFIIVSAVAYNVSLKILGWDIAIACLLFLATIFTADVARASASPLSTPAAATY